jgi:hypothetical protein
MLIYKVQTKRFFIDDTCLGDSVERFLWSHVSWCGCVLLSVAVTTNSLSARDSQGKQRGVSHQWIIQKSNVARRLVNILSSYSCIMVGGEEGGRNVRIVPPSQSTALSLSNTRCLLVNNQSCITVLCTLAILNDALKISLCLNSFLLCAWTINIPVPLYPLKGFELAIWVIMI